MKYCILLFLSLLFTADVIAQFNQLILRKNGKPVRRFTEGSEITIETTLGMKYSGTIYLLQNDSIYFNASGIPLNQIAVVYKNKRRRQPLIPMEKEYFLVANAGIPLFATILYLGGEAFWPAMATGTGLVYIPILLYNMQRILFHGNRKYMIGSVFDLQLLDLYRPEIVPAKNQ
jgi:hypothetical protein